MQNRGPRQIIWRDVEKERERELKDTSDRASMLWICSDKRIYAFIFQEYNTFDADVLFLSLFLFLG